MQPKNDRKIEFPVDFVKKLIGIAGEVDKCGSTVQTEESLQTLRITLNYLLGYIDSMKILLEIKDENH